MENTSRVAATANTPSLNASALDLLNSPCGSVGGVLSPEPSRLLAVAARSHGAPAAGAVPRPVEKRPPAGGRAAEPEPTPVVLGHGCERGAHDPAERSGHAADVWLEARFAVGPEPRPQLACRGGLIQRRHVDRVDDSARVRADDAAQRLPQSDRVAQVALIGRGSCRHQSVPAEPAGEGLWCRQRLGTILEVDAVGDTGGSERPAGADAA